MRNRDMVLNARCVGEEVPDCDAAPPLRRFGKIFCDCVVEADLVLFHQHHNCGGGKLL